MSNRPYRLILVQPAKHKKQNPAEKRGFLLVVIKTPK